MAVKLNYGTAGFRANASLLNVAVYRLGMLAVMRSKSVKGATIGVVITASHNPEEDNGIKLVDPEGQMLELSWEEHATKIANYSDEDLNELIKEIALKENVDMNFDGNVAVARDTRPSGLELVECLLKGIREMGGTVKNYELLTTPQLHYMVRCINSNGQYGEATEEGYYKKLSQAFNRLNANSKGNHYIPSVVVDCANGIGALKLKQLQPYLNNLNIQIVNASGKLNFQCGADYVKVQVAAPDGVQMIPGVRYVSFDGDADRIVYYHCIADGEGKLSFKLLDGDRIAILVADFLRKLLDDAKLDLHIGLVQTAYANGASTDYIKNTLKMDVSCVPTGVKYLHHEALKYDVGVYFEANGHGTVLFSDKAEQVIQEAADNKISSTAEKLKDVINLINQTTGDAISDMLLVETILNTYDWSTVEWEALYTDLPSRQLKVKVKDRYAITTADGERRVTSPPQLQPAIDKLVGKYQQGRSFARPSGTEDMVRVYAEADTQANADKLAREVLFAVHELAGGVDLFVE